MNPYTPPTDSDRFESDLDPIDPNADDSIRATVVWIYVALMIGLGIAGWTGVL